MEVKHFKMASEEEKNFKMDSEDSFSYLVPGHSEKHRRARNWTDSEMKALLYVWEEHHVDLKMSKRNARVYEKMSQRFFELTGEQRHKEEIKMKITNMSFQYRKLKCNSGESGEVPDWPYYKPIEKILSKPMENGRVNSFEFQASTAGSSSTSHAAAEGMMGFMPEYTGSSDEVESRPLLASSQMKQEVDDMSSDSVHSLHTLDSSSHRTPGKRRSAAGIKQLSLKKKKLKVMQAMLQEQKRVSHAMEETCREVRRAMHQQNFLQVQCLQLQERMMNLLEKMIQPPAAPSTSWGPSGVKDAGKG